MPAPPDDRVRFWAEQIRRRAAELKAKRESGAAADEPLEAIAARGKRKMLEVAVSALNDAATLPERTAAVAAMATALKANGFDGEKKAERAAVEVFVQEADVPDEDAEAPAEAQQEEARH